MTEGDKSEETTSIGSLGRRITEAVVVAAIALAGVLGGAWFTLLTKDHELKIRLVEIGIGILRADPKDDVTPARAWAIKVIQQNSGIDFTDEETNLLLHKPILSKGYGTGYADGEYTDSSTPSYVPRVVKPSPPAPAKPPSETK